MTAPRSFLFLQGPASPFFSNLGRALLARGHAVSRVNFCAGDRLFWRTTGAVDFRGEATDWPPFLRRVLASSSISDLVLFGDCRPLHAAAIAVARAAGVSVWVFEEGYLRPGWITLERDGTNGHSSLPNDRAEIERWAAELPPAPNARHRGCGFRIMVRRQAAYEIANLAGRPFYRHWRTHRPHGALKEFFGGWAPRGLKLRRVRQAADAATAAVASLTESVYLFPLQIDSDYQLRVHSAFGGVVPSVEVVVASFARRAPRDSLLVIKNHPLDCGMADLQAAVGAIARLNGVADRVRFVDGGHLPTLLSRSRAVVTVNSTVGLSALLAGCPVKVLGRAIYDVDGLCFQGGIDDFWGNATPPDATLLEALLRVVSTTQIDGGFHSESGIRLAVAGAVDRLEAAPARTRPNMAPGLLFGDIMATTDRSTAAVAA